VSENQKKILNGLKIDDPELYNGVITNQQSLLLYEGKGCDKCKGTAFQGRKAVFELMPITPIISEMILKKDSAYNLKEKAISEGMKTLRVSAVQNVIQGITTLQEIIEEVG
jgi:type II secretory ATPase GspE/PulE/Tfp pilus assembly ATPase PilB-like protein